MKTHAPKVKKEAKPCTVRQKKQQNLRLALGVTLGLRGFIMNTLDRVKVAEINPIAKMNFEVQCQQFIGHLHYISRCADNAMLEMKIETEEKKAKQ